MRKREEESEEGERRRGESGGERGETREDLQTEERPESLLNDRRCCRELGALWQQAISRNYVIMRPELGGGPV